MATERPRCPYPWQQMLVDVTGEVVPCCYWATYCNTGAPLGNTNVDTLSTIWNAEPYRELRHRVAAGDLRGYPCEQCLSYRAGTGLAQFLTPSPFVHDGGHCYRFRLPSEPDGTIPTGVDEDGTPLPHPDAQHVDIRRLGLGRFSFWRDWLYLSSSDGSSPILNGRQYTIHVGDETFDVPRLVTGTPSGDNFLVALDEFQRGVDCMQARVQSLTFNSTADCNIDCVHCSQKYPRLVRVAHRPQTQRDVMELVPFLLQFLWQGGEPLVIPDVRHFIDGFEPSTNPHLRFGFATNGVLLTPDLQCRLARFPSCNIVISMDGLDRDSFERIRAGARFDLVERNMLAAFARYREPWWVVSVNMCLMKSTMQALVPALRYVIAHDIALNLSPVLSEPVYERLDLFADWRHETAGWDGVLQEALDIVTTAKANGATAIRRKDPEGILQTVVEDVTVARRRYADTVELDVTVLDPTGSLPTMRRPGVIFEAVIRNGRAREAAYVEFDRGPGTYVARVPREFLTSHEYVAWTLCHDLYEDWGYVYRTDFEDLAPSPLPSTLLLLGRLQLLLTIPRFSGVQRPSNARLSRTAADHGLEVRCFDDLKRAYLELRAGELPADLVHRQAARAWSYRMAWRLPTPLVVDLEPPYNEYGGNCWWAPLEEFADLADDDEHAYRSPLLLFEDDELIVESHTSHRSIADIGRGRFSHWTSMLFFSSSDNSNPNTNGRRYRVVYCIPQAPPTFLERCRRTAAAACIRCIGTDIAPLWKTIAVCAFERHVVDVRGPYTDADDGWQRTHLPVARPQGYDVLVDGRRLDGRDFAFDGDDLCLRLPGTASVKLVERISWRRAVRRLLELWDRHRRRETTRVSAPFTRYEGLAFRGIVSVPTTQGRDGSLDWILYEDDRPLPHPAAEHVRLFELGGGRYSIWNGDVIFSTSDNSDPNTNGRTYRLVGRRAHELIQTLFGGPKAERRCVG